MFDVVSPEMAIVGAVALTSSVRAIAARARRDTYVRRAFQRKRNGQIDIQREIGCVEFKVGGESMPLRRSNSRCATERQRVR